MAGLRSWTRWVKHPNQSQPRPVGSPCSIFPSRCATNQTDCSNEIHPTVVVWPAARLLLQEAAEAEGLALVVEDEVGAHARPQARVQAADLALDALLHGDVAAPAAALAPPPPAVDVLPLYDGSPAG